MSDREPTAQEIGHPVRHTRHRVLIPPTNGKTNTVTTTMLVMIVVSMLVMNIVMITVITIAMATTMTTATGACRG